MKITALNYFSNPNYKLKRNCAFKESTIFSNVKEIDMYKRTEPYRPILDEFTKAGLEYRIEYNSKSSDFRTKIQLSSIDGSVNKQIFGYASDRSIDKKTFDKKMFELIMYGIQYMNCRIKKLEEIKTVPKINS